MKIFTHLVQDIIALRRCGRCGLCVAFCSALNLGALEMDEGGKPRYKDQTKCIECGMCYRICPETDDLLPKIAQGAPIGGVVENAMARSRDREIVARARDGGVVTAILLHLFDTGLIDGAIVTKIVSPFTCRPWLAMSRQEIVDACGFHFDVAGDSTAVEDRYAVCHPWLELINSMTQNRIHRVAFVGRPCQIKNMRRMEAEAVKIKSIERMKYYLGLFCMGSFRFGERERIVMEKIGGFKWQQVTKINFKHGLQIHLESGEIKKFGFNILEHIKRYTCHFCSDYAAEFADISFGGLGAKEGWTHVITRTDLGKAVWAEIGQDKLEIFKEYNGGQQLDHMLRDVHEMSLNKIKRAQAHRASLGFA